VVRGDDAKVRAFYNICRTARQYDLYDLSGNAKRTDLHLPPVVRSTNGAGTASTSRARTGLGPGSLSQARDAHVAGAKVKVRASLNGGYCLGVVRKSPTIAAPRRARVRVGWPRGGHLRALHAQEPISWKSWFQSSQGMCLIRQFAKAGGTTPKRVLPVDSLQHTFNRITGMRAGYLRAHVKDRPASRTGTATWASMTRSRGTDQVRRLHGARGRLAGNGARRVVHGDLFPGMRLTTCAPRCCACEHRAIRDRSGL